MAVHPNIAVLDRFYELFTGGEIADLLMADAFVHVGGDNALSGMHQGRQAAVECLNKYRSAATDGIELDIHDLLTNDDHGLAIVRVTARRDHETYDEWETHVFELVDGAIAGVFVYWNDPGPADEFFA